MLRGALFYLFEMRKALAEQVHELFQVIRSIVLVQELRGAVVVMSQIKYS